MASPEISESAATPAAVRESESILAPILVGYRSPERGTSLAAIVSTASLVVPHMTIMRKQMAGRKAVAVAHTREIFTSHDPDREGYSLIARCCDRAPDEPPSEAFARWNWEIGFFAFKEGFYPNLIPAGRELIRLDVTRYQLRNRGVIGAPQLALFRHMFVESFAALDPSALVFGGQRDWRAEWWPNPAVEA
jgi:hypothetical protein